MQIKTILIFMLVASSALAAGQGGAHTAGMSPEDLRTVLWQAFNFSLVVLIIYFAVRKSLPELFHKRQEGFVASAKKAEEAKAEAEKMFLDIKNKLEHLNTTYEESVSRARAEATDLRKQLIQEAEEQARHVKQEAEVTVKSEMQKAQRELRETFVREAVGIARGVLSKDIASSDHQKLQTEFSKNIEAVSP